MANMKIPRIADQDLASKLIEIHRDVVNGADFDFTFIAFGVQVGNNRISTSGGDGWQRIVAQGGTSIEYISVQLIPGLAFYFHRGGSEPQKSAYFDEISLALGEPRPDLLEASARISKLFRPIAFAQAPGDLADSVESVRALQEGTLNRLERLHEEGIRRNRETLNDLELKHQEREQSRDEDVQQLKATLHEAADKKQDDLKELADALEARSKKLDDRDNTHVRREIRNRMLDDVKDRIKSFGVSHATESKRRPVLVGILTLGMAFLLLLMFFLKEASFAADSSGAAWFLWLRVGLLSLGLSATILYYIRWQNRWAEQHSQSEFALQQFYIDVNRANWVLESCLEWHKVTGTPIPDGLLTSFTRQLFTAGDAGPPPVLHPADELASALLGSASKLKLKVGDSDLEFDKPGKIPKVVGT